MFWSKKRRRRRLLAEPFPVEWSEILLRSVRQYALLTSAEQAKLRDRLRVFVAEKEWEGCGGLQVTDEMKVTIAAQACLLVLGLEHDYYARVLSILVYPSGFMIPGIYHGTEAIFEGGEAVSGQA